MPTLRPAAFAGPVSARSYEPQLHVAASAPLPQIAAPTADGPSPAGSEASTPADCSATGSPLRGSPNRQEQLRTFQRYLQQQLALQQQGRYGPLAGSGGSAAGSATGSGSYSGAASPPSAPSPGRKESDASLLSWQPGSPPDCQEGATAGAAGSAAGTAALPPMPPGSSRLSQSQFSARLQAAAGQAADDADATAAGLRVAPSASSFGSQQHPAWLFDGSAYGGSAPASGLPGYPGGPLQRLDSTFSSWGLPTPTTGTL